MLILERTPFPHNGSEVAKAWDPRICLAEAHTVPLKLGVSAVKFTVLQWMVRYSDRLYHHVPCMTARDEVDGTPRKAVAPLVARPPVTGPYCVSTTTRAGFCESSSCK